MSTPVNFSKMSSAEMKQHFADMLAQKELAEKREAEEAARKEREHLEEERKERERKEQERREKERVAPPMNYRPKYFGTESEHHHGVVAHTAISFATISILILIILLVSSSSSLSDTPSNSSDSGSKRWRMQTGLVKQKFVEAIQNYQQVEQQYQAKYKQRMEQQFRLPDATPNEVKVVVNDNQGGQIFAQALQSSDRYGESRAAYRELAQLFNDMSILVEEQDETIETIQMAAMNVEKDMDVGYILGFYKLMPTRFALSSEEMNKKIGRSFDNTQFFWHMVKFLEDPDFEEEVQELLHWWNSGLFPNKEELGDKEDVMDSIALLKAQKAAKCSPLEELD
ncbi:hypothetical protein JB92DRAFT_3134898 [Gautieria morchelliformis]|nr:hypothetical protein JB92DRAFT_3134898 [Gautieria morchelliformis]